MYVYIYYIIRTYVLQYDFYNSAKLERSSPKEVEKVNIQWNL